MWVLYIFELQYNGENIALTSVASKYVNHGASHAAGHFIFGTCGGLFSFTPLQMVRRCSLHIFTLLFHSCSAHRSTPDGLLIASSLYFTVKVRLWIVKKKHRAESLKTSSCSVPVGESSVFSNTDGFSPAFLRICPLVINSHSSGAGKTICYSSVLMMTCPVIECD